MKSLTKYNKVDDKDAKIGDDDAYFDGEGSEGAEGLTHHAGVRDWFPGASVPQHKLHRDLRHERHQHDHYEARYYAQYLHRRRNRHDSGADHGGRDVEHRSRYGSSIFWIWIFQDERNSISMDVWVDLHFGVNGHGPQALSFLLRVTRNLNILFLCCARFRDDLIWEFWKSLLILFKSLGPPYFSSSSLCVHRGTKFVWIWMKYWFFLFL